MSRPLADESTFRVIGHPARRAVLDMLRQGERPVGELLAAAKLSPQTMSEHFRMLRSAGLITQRRKGRQRLYMLHPDTLKAVSQWVAPYERLFKK